MRISGSGITLSPSDLSDFLACEHLTSLDLRVARGELKRPLSVDGQGDLIRRKGDEHEERYLAQLEANGRDTAKIDFKALKYDWDAASAATEQAIKERREVVFQACLVEGDWRGFADFLELQPDGFYEVVDTKLARSAKPKHLFQICFYSSVVGRIQGHTPDRMHIVLGDGRRETFVVSEYDAYYRAIRQQFLEAVAGGLTGTYPMPCDHCGVCAWKARCEQQWADDDHLIRVASISRKQIERLTEAGITTLAELGETPVGTRIDKLEPETFEKIRHQAALQLHHFRSGEHKVDKLPLKDKRGFALMPPHSLGDVFYDIEGDPFYDEDGSMEYLHGIVHDDGQFTRFWARDRDEEKLAFEQLIDWLVARRRQYPGMHVYHYANYERSALQALMGRHGTREDEVDDLLREHVLVDLYQVVRQALRISLPSYSLKKVEELYFPRRETDVVGGDESTVVFEEWLESRDDALLASIEAYNRDDCLSTWQLHVWLLGLRPPDLPWAVPPDEREMKDEAKEAKTEREVLQMRLVAAGREVVADMLDYHRRDAKPEWWEYFRRLTLDDQQLVDDAAAIGRITPHPEIEDYVHAKKQSFVYTLCFPAQESKVRSEAVDPATEKSPGDILSIDDVEGRILLKRGKKRHAEALPVALVPPKPLPNWEQRNALERLARAIDTGSGEHRAAREILDRATPRGRLDSPVGAALSLDESYLFVQGPPGSGKTYTGAEMAVALMGEGRRVGVASLSHKAINNFLTHVVAKGVPFHGLKKCGDWESSMFHGSDWIENSGDNADFVDDGHDLIAGTAWLFSREGVAVDTLFIDEAGQISLADALAMATSARNVVLLGDPQQLPQVSQGLQPPGIGVSVLEHLLGDHATLPEGRGLFLEESWRMRPEVCTFVSDVFYDGRLEPAAEALTRSLSNGAGLRFLPVEHSGNRQSSSEEAERIRVEIEALVGGAFTDADGTRELTYADVLVVAPYNAQVRLLRGVLPDEVRVGTVDKFQGQEAAIVFFSMTTSTGADLPRGIEFLFSGNRFNVAISRAQCLACVVASPKLLVADAGSPSQMRLINTVCRFAELAGP